MHQLHYSDEADKLKASATDRRRDIVMLSVLVPFSIACLVAFFMVGPALGGVYRMIFLLAPLIVLGVWTAYEQMHDLVWWRVHPLCSTCRRSYAITQRPKPGMNCPCCDTPLYPLQTPQDYKAMVLITAIIVIALPAYAVWASLVAKLD